MKNLQDMHIGTINFYLSIPLLTSVPLTKTVDFIFKEENVSSLGQRTNFGSGWKDIKFIRSTSCSRYLLVSVASLELKLGKTLGVI